MEIKDYSKYEVLPRTYGGKAGRKIAIIDENKDIWMIKFPQNTRNKETVGVSYTTSPLSEYISSHIYESLGFPTHETALGTYGGKVVVACKDFTVGKYYNQFEPAENLINTVDDDLLLSSSGMNEPIHSSQSYHNVNLEDWLTVFDKSEIAINNPELKQRFWDQFVVDAFISNSDRHGGNWSTFLIDNKIELAPVYDNGNSLYGKHSEERIAKLLNTNDYNSLVHQGNTPYYFEGHPLDSIKSIKKHSIGSLKDYMPLIAAIKRVVPKIDMEKINKIIDDIPSKANGLEIISDNRKEMYKKVLNDRYEKILLPSMREGHVKSRDLKAMAKGKGKGYSI